MTAVNFCYWLQGYFEVAGIKPNVGCTLTNEQAATIQRHLSLVFAHDIDPKAGGPAEQKKLNDLHSLVVPYNPDSNIQVRC